MFYSDDFTKIKARVRSVSSVLDWIMAIAVLLSLIIILLCFFTNIDKDNGAKISCIVIFTCIFIFCIPISLFEKRIGEYLNDQLVLEIQWSHHPFILILRSFSSHLNNDYALRENVYRTRDGDEFTKFEWEKVGDHLINLLPLQDINYHAIFLGGKCPNVSHIARLRTNDQEWFEQFLSLASASTVILVIPNDTKGICQELSVIMDNYKYKSIIVMPPTAASNDEPSSRRIEWTRLKSSLKETYGWNIPPYDEKGGFYLLSSLIGKVHPFSKNTFIKLIQLKQKFATQTREIFVDPILRLSVKESKAELKKYAKESIVEGTLLVLPGACILSYLIDLESIYFEIPYKIIMFVGCILFLYAMGVRLPDWSDMKYLILVLIMIILYFTCCN